MSVKSVITSSWVRWLVSVSLFSLLIYLTDVSAIVHTIQSTKWPWLLAGQVVALFLTIFGAIKWWVLMPRSRERIPVFIRVNFVSNFAGIFFPGIVGIEIARVAGITRSSKDFSAALSSVLVDRLFGLVTLGSTVMIGGIVASSVVPPIITISCLLSLALLLGGAVAIMSSRVREWSRRLLPRSIASALDKLYECLDLYVNEKPTLILSLVLSSLFQLCRVVMVYFLAKSLSVDVSFGYLIVVVPVALFVQMLPISIYGIGIRESAMIAMLAVAGVSAEMAVSLSILLLAVQIVGTVPGGILFALGYKLDTPPVDPVSN